MRRSTFRKKGRKNSKSFNPSHDDISKAVDSFINGGGAVKQLDPDNSAMKKFVEKGDGYSADDFLLGN